MSLSLSLPGNLLVVACHLLAQFCPSNNNNNNNRVSSQNPKLLLLLCCFLAWLLACSVLYKQQQGFLTKIQTFWCLLAWSDLYKRQKQGFLSKIKTYCWCCYWLLAQIVQTKTIQLRRNCSESASDHKSHCSKSQDPSNTPPSSSIIKAVEHFKKLRIVKNCRCNRPEKFSSEEEESWNLKGGGRRSISSQSNKYKT